jgi:uncharacterized protein YndB with AHSA1/START domain
VPGTLTATSHVVINADPPAVWAALTDTGVLGEAFFGSRIDTDFRVGSPITYSGEWEGKEYHDKGEVRRAVPNEVLVMTHWSPLSGTADTPENYSTVTYRIEPTDGGTDLSVAQDNVADQQSREHFESTWKQMLTGLKRAVER